MSGVTQPGWQEVSLGEVCEFRRGLTYKKSDEVDSGGTPVLRANNVDLATGELDLSDIRYISDTVVVPNNKKVLSGSLLICTASGSKKHLGKTALIEGELDYSFGGFMGLLVPSDRILPRFLQWLLRSDSYWQFIDGLADGANINNLKFNQLMGYRIPLPPLEEQRRIVAVLDEAFEGLARARAHAEANLQNARELVQSNIDAAMTSGSTGWDEYVVEDTLQRVRIPNKIKRTEYLERGEFPVVSQEAALVSGYWDNSSDVIRVERPLVVFGDHTRALKFVDFDFVVGADGTQLMSPIKEIEPDFFFYALRAIRLEGKGYARHFSHLKKEKLCCPRDQSHQRAIACRLREVERTAEELIENYEKKCSDLDELRQSLLRRAFAGELT